MFLNFCHVLSNFLIMTETEKKVAIFEQQLLQYCSRTYCKPCSQIYCSSFSQNHCTSGSCLQLHVLNSQCLSRHIASMDEVKRQICAWQKKRNNKNVKINWQFTNEQARIKLKRLYPSILD